MKLLDLLKGSASFFSYLCFTAVICTMILLIALLKFFMHVSFFQTIFANILNALVNAWIFCAISTHRALHRVNWVIFGAENLKIDRWCLILANHQSWVDIIALMEVFYRKIPPFKFFVKKELIWLPFIGLCAWAMDFPFMKRYTKSFLMKNPHLTGTDIDSTRRACEKFKHMPVSIVNFVEGTRFTERKRAQQKSPYKRLLNPRAGGASLVLYAMSDYLKQIFNVTIVYPDGIPGLWDFFCGRVKKICVDIAAIPVGKDLIGNYFTDEKFKNHFQSWLNQLWKEKDAAMAVMLAKHSIIQLPE